MCSVELRRKFKLSGFSKREFSAELSMLINPANVLGGLGGHEINRREDFFRLVRNIQLYQMKATSA